MNVLQQLNIAPGTALLLVVGLCVLCLVLPLLLSGIHVITAIVSLFTHLIASVTHVISGGPVAWCGCLVAIGGCGLVAFATWLVVTGLANCSVYHTNFCSLFGR